MRPAATLAVVALLAACGELRGRRNTGQAPPDLGSTMPTIMGDLGPPESPNVPIYAHSDQTLYRIDGDTLAIAKVGDFGWPNDMPNESMTDIAVDQTGRIVGVSTDGVFQINPNFGNSRRGRRLGRASHPGSRRGIAGSLAGA
jgi:hypothetical protein